MRLFVAVKFDKETSDAIYSRLKALKSCCDGGVFTRKENLHLTLAFIGESSRPQKALECIKNHKFEPFEVSLGSLGHFRDLYYLSVVSEGLAPLAEGIRKELLDAGFEIDTKPFVPHITLGRQCRLISEPAMTLELVTDTVSEVCLMRSDRINGKLVYTEIKEGRR